MVEELSRGGFELGEKVLGKAGKLANEGEVAGFVGKEGLVGAVAEFAGEGERGLAFGLQRRIEAEQVPIDAIDRYLHFVLEVVHAAFDVGESAGGVADGPETRVRSSEKSFEANLLEACSYMPG